MNDLAPKMSSSDGTRNDQMTLERTRVALRDSFISFRKGLPAQALARPERASPFSASKGGSFRQPKDNNLKAEHFHDNLPREMKAHKVPAPLLSRANSSPQMKYSRVAIGEPVVVGAIIATIAKACVLR
jgi:hypothetical protein